jgi:hypothetical protein
MRLPGLIFLPVLFILKKFTLTFQTVIRLSRFIFVGERNEYNSKLYIVAFMDNFRRGLHSFFVTRPKMYQLY